MADKEIKGVIVPMLTPLNPDETVDIGSLRRLVNYLIDNGVHGLWASGTTGEFANLPDSERVRAMEATVDEVAGRVPVICNISSTSTKMSVELASEVRELGMDGIALTPPYYYPDSQDELADHYRYAQDQIGLPLWVYNIPQTVKTAVEPGTIAMLAAEGTVVGVKDSSGAGELLAQLNVLCDQGDLSLLRFLGTVFRVTSAGSVGVHGVIPGIANLVPEVCARGWEAGEAGDTETVRDCNGKLLTAQKVGAVAKGGSANAASFGGMKAALKQMGVIDHDIMSRPFRQLTEEEKSQIPPILEDLGLK
ncbi:MAG: dihydrodipicolinate synthase family protein [Dehalococcoidia bacterium]|nr:dihydrodipicolinate synthase family protein [Dehalococcoidia bacterium]